MIRNYIKTAVRIFLRQKSYSLINVLGLSVGLVATLLISVYVADELSYDRFFADADKIYRVGEFEKFDGTEIYYTESGAPIADALRHDLPELKSVVRVATFRNQPVRYRDKSFFEPKFLVGDSNFFQFFNHVFIEGDPATCLKGPNKIVVTESTARRYFGYQQKGDGTTIGKMIEVVRKEPSAQFKRPLVPGSNAVEVSAIVADPPGNTHMHFDMVFSLDSWEFALHDNTWTTYDLYTYFKLDKPSSLPLVEKQLKYYMDHNLLPHIEKDLGVSLKDMNSRGDAMAYFVQPLTSIHLYSNLNGELEGNGDIRYVYIFGAIAIFIILIACANFVNLATARALQRAKEVGIRKTIGAEKIGLIRQFMLESFMYVLIAGVVALILFAVLIQPFNNLSGKTLSADIFFNPVFIIGTAFFLLMVTLIAGSYPAFYLTSFKPAAVLKGKFNMSQSRFNMKNTLVTFQFVITMILIISTTIIYKQLQFIQSQNLGFDRSNMLKIARTENLKANVNAFKEELLRHPEFLSASYSNQLPPDISTTFFTSAEHSNQLVSVFNVVADYDYLTTMGYTMKSGRFFSRDFPSDSMAVVINESCAKVLGFKEAGGYVGKAPYKNLVVGIVKDFNFGSPREKIDPLLINLWTSPDVLAVRIKPGNTEEAVRIAENIWKSFSTGLPFEYSFLDEDLAKVFHAEQRMGSLFKVFTGMSIFVACLGLFGLITLTSAQRAREVGIRKVLGGSVGQITVLLSSDLLKLVLISFVIAVPLAWYGMNQWLQGFAYRTNFDPFVVVMAGIGCLTMAMLTVGYKAFKAASANPVTSLKND